MGTGNVNVPALVRPLATALGFSLHVEDERDITGAQDRTVEFAPGARFLFRAKVLKGWITPEQQAIVYLSLRGRLYALATYGGNSQVTTIYLIDRSRFGARPTEEQIERGQTISTVLSKLGPGIIAGYWRGRDEKWYPVSDKTLKVIQGSGDASSVDRCEA